MARVKVTSRFDILKNVDRFVNRSFADSIGTTVKEQALRLIANGQSPVRGEGRFQRYRNPQVYPGRRKNKRPVNLKLTGAMLSFFDHRQQDKLTVRVGLLNAPSKERLKALRHNLGHGQMPMRRFIPQKGEEWSVGIMRSVRNLYKKRLEKLIRDSNKK